MSPAVPLFKPASSLMLWTCANQTTLLQTAQAVVYKPDNPRCLRRVRIILNLGSQGSYVMEELRQELELHKMGEQSMSMSLGLAVQLCMHVIWCKLL